LCLSEGGGWGAGTLRKDKEKGAGGRGSERRRRLEGDMKRCGMGWTEIIFPRILKAIEIKFYL
jgi:hypothetical protein